MRKRQVTLRSYDTIRRTTCCNCPTGCGLKVFLKNNTVVDIFGDEEHPVNKGALCPKGLLAYRHLNNPDRLSHPRIRERLDGPFLEATWEKAIAFVSDKLRRIAEEAGKEALVIHGDDSSPFEYLAAGDLFARNFGTDKGPYRFLPHSDGIGSGVYGMFGVPASGLLMNTIRDWCNSRCIVVYRSDLAASDPITFGHIIDARDRGAILIVIDGKHSITSSKATISLRARPGTESAILKAVLHYIIGNELFDKDFLQESALDHSSLMSGLEDFSPERVARCSGIKKTEIEKAAGVIGRSKPLQVITADWNTRRYLSEEEIFLCGAIVSFRGSIGIPGGGLNLMAVSPFPGNNHSHRPLSLENVILSGEVRALIWQGNPSARMAGGKSTKKSLKELPLVVHLSSYPNETFRSSHVSLPLSSWLEYPGLVHRNNSRSVQWHHKVVDPPAECRSPLEFWNGLAGACGLSEDAFFPRKPGTDYAAEFANLLLKQNPLTQFMSVEKLDPEKNPPGGLLWPCIMEGDLEFENSRFIRGDIRGRNILFQRGQHYPMSDRRFPTPTGKITFSLSTPGGEDSGGHDPEGKNGCPLPSHDETYPMLLITGLLVDYVEEYGYFVSDRDEWSAPLVVKMHPRTGKLLGVKNGREIIVENDKGSFTAPVWLSEEVDDGVIWCPEGLDPYQPHRGCESPRSLFDIPSRCSAACSSARAAVYKPGQDRLKTTRMILEFLDRLMESRIDE